MIKVTRCMDELYFYLNGKENFHCHVNSYGRMVNRLRLRIWFTEEINELCLKLIKNG